MAQSVIMLEFNELSPRLMEEFIGKGLLPGFRRLRDESITAITDAEEEGDALEPWVQWTTAHTGLPYATHKVLKLSDGPNFRGTRVWDAVSDAGRKVWVCGSMNAAIRSDTIDGLVVPDPWASNIDAHPSAFFAPYYHFVRSYVQGYTSETSPVTKADTVRFARFMVANGLSVKTVFDTLRQLAGEYGGLAKWRRAPILDRLQWDVFRHNYRRVQPTLSTFFLNSTAHYQHYYWRDLEPDLFTIKPSEDHLQSHKDAILFGYQKMDEIVQEALSLAGPDTAVVLCTGLSQQPMLRYEEEGGKQVFKSKDPEALMALAAVPAGYRYVPVMAEEFQLHYTSEADATEAQARLEALKLQDGTPFMRVSREGDRVYAGCALIAHPGPEATIVTPHSNRSLLFATSFYGLEGVKSGMHHPDGLLWIRTPSRAHLEVARKVSLEELAPTLMHLCGLDASVFPRAPLAEVTALDVAVAA